MSTLRQTEGFESDSVDLTTMMNPDIDWLHSQASLCKVNLFSSDKLKGDNERKLVCFVDVSSLHARERNQNLKQSMCESKDKEPLDGFDLEEKEIFVIKDDNKNPSNTEGSVCFFKQGHCVKGDVVNWLSNDLQKYAVGFHHALTPSNNPQKSIPFDSAADNSSQNSTATFNCPGA